MKFNVAIPKYALSIIKQEFPHDNIIIFDKSLFEEYFPVDDNFNFNEEQLMLLRFILIKKYKNLIFIDYPNIMIKSGLRKEIVQLSKTKDQFIYFNEKYDFFYSKSCLPEIEDTLLKIKNLKNLLIIKNFSLFMTPNTREYNFENIIFYDGLKYYTEFFLRTDNILLLNLNNNEFNYKKYKKYLKNSFLIGYNSPYYGTGKQFGINNLLLLNFDISKLPIRYDVIKTYKNIETEKMYVGYFSEINCKGIL